MKPRIYKFNGKWFLRCEVSGNPFIDFCENLPDALRVLHLYYIAGIVRYSPQVDATDPV